jgi:ligand-binding sensor domain-containing protein
MKKQILLILSLCFSVMAQAGVIFDPATYSGTLPAGMSKVTINNTVYLQVVLNGWNSTINLDQPFVFGKTGMIIKSQIKYKRNPATDTIANLSMINGVAQLIDTISADKVAVSWSSDLQNNTIGLIQNPVNEVFSNISAAVPTTATAVHRLQFFGQEHYNWTAVSGDTIWVGRIIAYDPNSLSIANPATFNSSSLPEGITIDTINSEKYFKINLLKWNRALPIEEYEMGDKTEISFKAKLDVGTSGFTNDQVYTFLNFFDAQSNSLGAYKEISTADFKTCYVKLNGNPTSINTIQFAGQENVNWTPISNAYLYISEIKAVQLLPKKTLTINPTSSAPNIDGTVSASEPWGTNWNYLDRDYRGNSTSSMVSKFQMTYDNNYLYLISHTQDATPLTDWESDGSELYFNMNNASASDGVYYDGIWQIRKVFQQKGLGGGYGTSDKYTVWDLSKLMRNPNFKVAEADSAGYYTFEWRIPWLSLIQNMNSTWNGQSFNFDMISKDKTSSSTSPTQLQMWNSISNEQWKNSTLFGTVTLSNPIQYVWLQDTIGTISYTANSSAYVKILSNSSWTASSDQSWLTVATTSGSGNYTLSLNATANTTGAVRTAQVKVAISADNYQIFTLTQNADYDLIINKISETPILDGVGNDAVWQNAPTNYCNHTTYGVPAEGNFKMMYDDTYIYVLTTVNDYTPMQNGNSSWLNDNVELYFAMDSANSTSYRSGDWQIRKSSDTLVSIDGLNALSSNSSFKVIQTGTTTYVQEWRFSIEILSQGSAFDGKSFRFDCQIANNNGTGCGRTGQSYWHSYTDDLWNTVVHQAYVKLSEPIQILPIKVVDIMADACGNQSRPVSTLLLNYGKTNINSLVVKLIQNGDTIASETVNTTILPGDTLSYTFNNLLTFSKQGEYTVKVVVENTGGKIEPSYTKSIFSYGTSAYDKWSAYSNCDKLPAQNIQYVMKDHNNNMWIGTKNGDVARMDINGNWTYYNGISKNGVTCLLEDHSGNLWACFDQDNGYTAMFNGTSWSIPDSSIVHTLSAFEDSKNNIWFGSWDHGVKKYNPTTKTIDTYSSKTGEIPGFVSWYGAIMEDSSKNIWIASSTWGSGGGGLTKYDGSTWKTYNASNSNMPTGDVACSLIDSKGNIWVGYGWTGGGISKYDGINWTNYSTDNSGLNSNQIFQIFEDAQGHIWFGSYSGICSFNGINWKTYNSQNSGLLGNSVNSIAEDGKNNIWIATSRGISVFEESAALLVQKISIDECGDSLRNVKATLRNFGGKSINTFQISYIQDSTIIVNETANISIAAGDSVIYTFSKLADLSKRGQHTFKVYTNINNGDTSTNISLATAIYSYGSYEPFERWRSITTCNGLPYKSAQYILRDSKKNMWMATSSGIAKMDTANNWTYYNMSNSGFSNNLASSLMEDHNGNIWACFDQDEGQVAMFNGSTWIIPDASIVHTLTAFEDSKNNIWFGSWDHGVKKYNPTTKTIDTYSPKTGEIPGYVSWYGAIMEDSAKNIWIASSTWNQNGGGLTKYDGSTWKTFNINNSNMPVNDIACSMIDSKGNIWIGYGWSWPQNFGVSKFDGSTWTTYTTENSGLNSGVVLQIFEDSKGNMWFGTGNSVTHQGGICKFDGKNWTSYNANNSGLLSNATTSISEDAKGDIWIGTSYGVSIFETNKLKVSTDSLSIDADANSTAKFNISSNIDWKISTNQSWLSASEASGSGNATVSLTANKNPLTTKREAILTVSGKDVDTLFITVTQAGEKPFLSLSTDTITVGDTTSIVTFSITSNTSWTVNSDQNWVTVAPQSGTNNASDTLTISANTTTEERKAIITVSSQNNEDQIVVIIQKAVWTGIKPMSNTALSIYPNPAKTAFRITNLQGKAHITIFDINGKILIDKNIVNSQVDLSQLSSGFYTIKIVENNKVTTLKFVKE